MRLARRLSLPAQALVAFASGLALSLAFPPVEAWPLALVAPAPYLWLALAARPRRGFMLGLAFGIGFFGANLSWISLFGGLAWTVLTLASALTIAFFGLLLPAVRRPGRPLVSALGAAALWTVLDALRGMWPLGGFTWGQLGVSQVDNRVTVRLATLAGVWGVTFVVVVVNALLVEAVGGGGGGWRRLGRVGLAAVFGLGPLAIPFATADGRAIDVATLQVDWNRAQDLTREGQDRSVARMFFTLHRTLSADPPDLAVWGESSLDPGATLPEFFPNAQAAVAAVGVPTVAGSVQHAPGGGLTNTVIVMDGEGRVVDSYTKVHLVPYGEYIPWRPAVGWISALRQIPYELVPGSDWHTVSAPGLPAFATPICFENAFPAIDREMVNKGAEFLVVVTNNASYERTAASRQHLQMSRMRAIEDGRWVVHAGVSGISAYVDPTGRIVAERGLFQTAILRGTIRASSARTWYVRLGDWVPWGSLAWVLALAAAPRRRRIERPAPPKLPAGCRTLVILPTYDERETIEAVLRGVLERPEAVQVLVVDDGSPDGTAQVVRAVMATEPRVRLVERPAKSGLASAYLEGFRTALAEGHDLVVEMDSDLSHDPAELSRLLGATADAYDLIVGSRYVLGGRVSNWSRARLALSRGGNRYARFMLGFDLHDATSGYRVYRRDLLSALVREPFRADGYGFQIELVLRAWRGGYRVGEVPITFREREHGRSKISRRIVIEALWLVTKWGVRARFPGGRDVAGNPR